jgi:integrase
MKVKKPKRKNLNGQGSIRERADGRWEARYTDANGMRRSIMGKTAAEVEEKLTAAKNARNKGMPSAPDARKTVGQYAAEWLESRRRRIRESTWIRYEQHIRLQIVPVIGRVHLIKLNRDNLQHLYARCLADGLAPSSVAQVHTLMHHILKDAMRSDLIQRNVAELANPPRVEKREMQIYTTEQVETLLDAAEGHWLAPMIALTVATGLRAGEVIALRWRDVDLPCGVLHVKRTRTRTAKGYVDGRSTKTGSGVRDIRLVPFAVDALKSHRARQAAERLRLGELWVDEDRVFPSSMGKALDASNFHRQWGKLLARASLPEIHFHDLRHSAASWLLSQGVPVVDVSKLLGHANPAITMRFYAHALPDSQDRVAAAMETLLPSRKKDTAQEG